MRALPTVVRSPSAPLDGMATLTWSAPGRGAGQLERVIPTGGVHLVWRIGAPVRIADAPPEWCGVVAGARSAAHVHHTSTGGSVGVMLKPGAVPRLFGVSARAIAERHVGLVDLWGPAAAALQEQLDADPTRALERVEAWLAAAARPDRTPDGLGVALAALDRGWSVEAAAKRVGRTPRALGGWFADAVGLSPIRWATVRRVRRAMVLAGRGGDGSEVARGAGYADHAHLCRDFRAVTGLTMGQWRRDHRPGEPSHVPVSVNEFTASRASLS